jgi:hypothetical protein
MCSKTRGRGKSSPVIKKSEIGTAGAGKRDSMRQRNRRVRTRPPYTGKNPRPRLAKAVKIALLTGSKKERSTRTDSNA